MSYYRDQIRELSPEEAVEHLLAELDYLTVPVETLPSVFDGAHWTQTEMRCLNHFWAYRGSIVNKEQLLRSVYFDRPHDIPEYKIVDVYICKIRAKLKAASIPVTINTKWGVGYWLEVSAQHEKAA